MLVSRDRGLLLVPFSDPPLSHRGRGREQRAGWGGGLLCRLTKGKGLHCESVQRRPPPAPPDASRCPHFHQRSYAGVAAPLLCFSFSLATCGLFLSCLFGVLRIRRLDCGCVRGGRDRAAASLRQSTHPPPGSSFLLCCTGFHLLTTPPPPTKNGCAACLGVD